jgi:hypothetical protein
MIRMVRRVAIAGLGLAVAAAQLTAATAGARAIITAYDPYTFGMSVQEAAAAEPSPFQTVKGAQPLPGVKLVYYTRATTVRISGDMRPAQLTFAFGRGRLVWMQVAVPDVPFRTVVHMILDTYDVSLTIPTDPYGLPIIKLQDAQGNILGVAPLKGTTWDSSGARLTYLWGVFKRETGF